MTQAEVAVAAGVRDVKTIRNLETGRNWPNDLTRRGVEIALRIEIGTLDRMAEGLLDADFGRGASGALADQGRAHAVTALANTLPTAQELIDLSGAVTKLSSALEAMLRRGDNSNTATVRSLIDAVSAVIAGYAPALEDTVARTEERGLALR